MSFQSFSIKKRKEKGKMEKINYTVHEINVYDTCGEKQIETVKPSGMMVRILNDRESIEIDGIRLSTLTSKKLVLLSREDFLKKIRDINFVPTYHEFPEPQKDTFYIVSSMVQDASERTDLLSPDTDNPVLDTDGKIIGCTGYIVKNFDDLEEK
jgi:hypothetical protein